MATPSADPEIWSKANAELEMFAVGKSGTSIEEMQEMCSALDSKIKEKIAEHAEMAAQWRTVKNYADRSVDLWEERVRRVKRKLPPMSYRLGELKAAQAWMLMRDKPLQENWGRTESTAESPAPQSQLILQVILLRTLPSVYGNSLYLGLQLLISWQRIMLLLRVIT